MVDTAAKAEAVRVAVDKIVAALDGDDPCVVDLAKGRSDEAIKALIRRVLGDRDLAPRVAASAVWLARVFHDSDVIRELVNVVRERPDMAMSAGAALAQVGARSDLSQLGDVLADPSAGEASRWGAARALSGWLDRRVAGILVKGLHAASNSVLVQSEVIQAIAWAEIRGMATNTSQEIRPLLRAEEPDVRYSAIIALGNLGATEAIADVAGLLEDPDVTSHGESVGEQARRVVSKLEEDLGRPER